MCLIENRVLEVVREPWQVELHGFGICRCQIPRGQPCSTSYPLSAPPCSSTATSDLLPQSRHTTPASPKETGMSPTSSKSNAFPCLHTSEMLILNATCPLEQECGCQKSLTDKVLAYKICAHIFGIVLFASWFSCGSWYQEALIVQGLSKRV